MSAFEPAEPLLGVQTPRILHVPSAPRAHSAGPEAVALAASAGLILDPWQQLILDHLLSVRPDGKWCASEAGVMVSRQNGKGSVIEALELWALYIGEEQVLHTAHLFKTSAEGFRRIEGLIMNTPELRAEVARIVRGHGEEAIELHSGARLMFGTRTKGGARGLTLDRIIADEAMYLNEEQAAALLPTVSARPNPQICYLGSAGTKESTHFGRVRSRAITGDDPRLLYCEWSIDPHTDYCTPDCEDHDPPDTVESYAKANPALGRRLSLEHVEGEQRSMGDEVFAQERLGVGDWPEDGEAWSVIAKELWEARVDETSDIDDTIVLAVDTTPDRSWSCIAVAGLNGDGMTHVEITGDEDGVLDHRPGVQWVVPAVEAMWKAAKPAAVVIDTTSQAGSFISDLEDAGITVLSPNSRDYAQACGELYSAVVPRKGEQPTLVHLDQPPLNNAVAGAGTRKLADMWAWDKRGSGGDISPLVAVTLACWGLRRQPKKPRAKAAWG